MKYLDQLFESINRDILIPESGEGIEYNSPHVFDELDEDSAEPKKESIFDESFHRLQRALKTLDEISYNDFKSDPTNNSKVKLNNCIAEINTGLRQAEKLIDHALKLKTEIGADQSIFYKDTFRKFQKIGSRMNKLQTKIREFSK